LVGKIARVNLTTVKLPLRTYERKWRFRILGGRGFGARIFYDEVGPSVEPFSPKNLLILATGPLNGTKAPSSSRFSVTTKSPLTGRYSILIAAAKRYKNQGRRYDVLIMRQSRQTGVVDGG